MHFPGPKGPEMPIVWVFPQIEVCLECSFAGFEIPERELRVLGQDVPADAKGMVSRNAGIPQCIGLSPH